MTVELMRKLHAEGATSIPELRTIFGLSESGVYRYLESTDLKAARLFSLFRLAKSDRVRELILEELLPGTGYHAHRLPDATDLDGDGDVDTDDALKGANRTIRQASDALSVIIAHGQDHTVYLDARRALADAADHALAAIAVIDWLEAQHAKRRKARALPALNGKAVGHG